jgi:hypothetical protein
VSKYPTIFAGAVLGAGTVDIYIVRHHELAFTRAVAGLDTAGLPYVIKRVMHSWAAMVRLRNWIVARASEFRREGIVLVFWAPDPEMNAVQVQFQKPGERELSELRSTVARLRVGRRPLRLPAATKVTRISYSQVATAALNAQIPPGVGVVSNPVFGSPGRTVDGSADTTPFYGGDKIFYRVDPNLSQCTGGFAVNSASNPSAEYMITAAHCSYVWDATNLEHHFYTCYTRDSTSCNYDMGAVEAIYWNSEHDYELINATSIGRSVEGKVWDNRTSNTWSMNGYTDVAVNDKITWDGWVTGAVFDTTVTGVNGCGWVSYGNSNTNYSGSHYTCDLIAATNNGSPPCQGGDSGGPVLVRESGTTNAEAVATIVAVSQTVCWAQEFSVERNEANIRLIWGT